MQKEVINQYNNKLEEQLVKLFHKSNLPEFYGMRWINETVNSVLKRTQLKEK